MGGSKKKGKKDKPAGTDAPSAADDKPKKSAPAASAEALQLEKLRKQIMPLADACAKCKELQGERLFSTCARCGVAKYCSRECQVAHWSGHKEMCRAYGAAQQAVREQEERTAWEHAFEEKLYVWPQEVPVQLQSAPSHTVRRLLVKNPDLPTGRRSIAACELEAGCKGGVTLTMALARALYRARVPDVANRIEGVRALGEAVAPLALALGALHDGAKASRSAIVVVEVNYAPIEVLMSSRHGSACVITTATAFACSLSNPPPTAPSHPKS